MRVGVGVSVVALGAFVACSGNGSGGVGGGAGGSGGGAGGGTASTRQGVVTVGQTPFAATFRHTFSAAFHPMGAPGSGADSACIVSTSGSCTVKSCDGGVTIFDGGQIVSAGTLAVTLAGAPLFTGLNAGGGGYYLDFSDGNPWAGGEEIGITASGSDGGVPGFSATLPTPSRIEISSDGGALDLTRGTPFPIAWKPGSGDLFVGIYAATGGSSSVNVSCTVPASTGSFTVPSAVTQAMPLGGYVQLSLQNTTTVSKPAGGWSITTFASSSSKPVPITVH